MTNRAMPRNADIIPPNMLFLSLSVREGVFWKRGASENCFAKAFEPGGSARSHPQCSLRLVVGWPARFPGHCVLRHQGGDSYLAGRGVAFVLSGPIRFNTTVNVLPWPSPRLEAVMVPPCRSTMACTIANPSPAPPGLCPSLIGPERVRALSAR